ncbi:MAG: ATP-binding protein, partial [Myxococcales bacterium]|nr:ATP-binding protein [Myxococcales bacterium]
ESETVEFKESALQSTKSGKSRPHTIVRAIAGLANARGGTLLIGVKDDGTVSGIAAEVEANAKGRDGWELNLFTKLKDVIGAAAASALQLRFQQFGGVEVAVVRVPPSPVPVYVRHDGEQLLFVRIGNQCLALDAKQAKDYCAKRWP